MARRILWPEGVPGNVGLGEWVRVTRGCIDLLEVSEFIEGGEDDLSERDTMRKKKMLVKELQVRCQTRDDEIGLLTGHLVFRHTVRCFSLIISMISVFFIILNSL
jgi:hypothetical protein